MKLTTAQFAAKLGVSGARIRQLAASGRIVVEYITPRMMLIDSRELSKVKHRPAGRPRKKNS